MLLFTGCAGKTEGVYYAPLDSAIIRTVSAGTGGSFLYTCLLYNETMYTSLTSFTTLDKSELDLDHFLGNELGTVYYGSVHWHDDPGTYGEGIIQGTLYQIQGYDPAFRICVYYEQKIGTDTYFCVKVFDCLNNITLNKGSDLFTDRLHLEDACQVTYKESSLPLDGALLNPLLSAMNEAPFLNPSDETFQDLDSLASCPLIFTDKHGIQTQITVYDGYAALHQAGVDAMVVALDPQLCVNLFSEN